MHERLFQRVLSSGAASLIEFNTPVYSNIRKKRFALYQTAKKLMTRFFVVQPELSTADEDAISDLEELMLSPRVARGAAKCANLAMRERWPSTPSKGKREAG